MRSILANFINRMTRRQKRAVQVSIDVALLAFCAWLAFQLRLGFGFNFNTGQIKLIAIAPVIAIPIFVRFGLYRAVLRYLPDRAIWSIVQAVTISVICWTVIVFVSGRYGLTGVPRSIPLLYWLISLSAVVMTRFAAKWYLLPDQSRSSGEPTVIYGAGEAGIQLTNAIAGSPKHRIVGFVDDDSNLIGSDVGGYRVYGPSDIPLLIENFGVTTVILCIPSADSADRLRIGAMLGKFPVRVQTVPSITDITTGRYVVQQARDISIEELVGRSAVPADQKLISQVLKGKRVLVTGAGGSIGSSLSALIAAQPVAHLVLVDNSEFSMYQTKTMLTDRIASANIQFVLASVTDEDEMRQIITDHAIDTVFHAAAFKHVNLVEDNPAASIRNNIGGAEVVARLAYENGVRRFVFISTDKAVKPTSVMGATKRVGELIVRKYADMAQEKGTGQSFLTVRFGNVLGSRGSVVPRFTDQIARGGPVTVTDRAMTRYFMATSEATELIVQAAALSSGGETFLLDMGEPISIYQLAHDMIGLAGLEVRDENNPDGDIEVVITGAKPGEKMHEDLMYDPASVKPTTHPKIVKVKRKFNAEKQVLPQVRQLFSTLETSKADPRTELFAMLERLQSAPDGGFGPDIDDSVEIVAVSASGAQHSESRQNNPHIAGK